MTKFDQNTKSRGQTISVKGMDRQRFRSGPFFRLIVVYGRMLDKRGGGRTKPGRLEGDTAEGFDWQVGGESDKG